MWSRVTAISEAKNMLGILGGTFDPIHNGHILPALACAKQLGIKRIKLLPLGVAVHKPQPIARADQRIAMCECVMASHPIFEVDTREIARGGQSYSIITLQELRAELGDEQPLCWLMGQDAISHFTSWKDWQGILKLAHIAVMRRGGYAKHQALPAELMPFVRDGVEGVAGCIVCVDVAPIEVSSTELRALLAQSKNNAHALKTLPESVRQYALKERIYSPNPHPEPTQ